MVKKYKGENRTLPAFTCRAPTCTSTNVHTSNVHIHQRSHPNWHIHQSAHPQRADAPTCTLIQHIRQSANPTHAPNVHTPNVHIQHIRLTCTAVRLTAPKVVMSHSRPPGDPRVMSETLPITFGPQTISLYQYLYYRHRLFLATVITEFLPGGGGGVGGGSI